MKQVTFLILNILLCICSIVHSQTTEEQDMLNLVNQLRQDNGLQILRLNTSLNQAAKDHSSDMANNNYFSHTGLNDSSFSQRAIAAGYKGFPRGENIAAGNSSVTATFNQWVNSSGHLNNMLNSGSNEMGIGHAYNSNAKYGHYWTQIFGKGDQTLSDDDFTNTNKMEIYPNPVKAKVSIEIKNGNETEFNLKLITVTGQIVYQKSKKLINGLITIDIKDLTSGIYFLNIQNVVSGHKIMKI